MISGGEQVDIINSVNWMQYVEDGSIIALNYFLKSNGKKHYGKFSQYSTIYEHMPPDRPKYAQWNGDRFILWAGQSSLGTCTRGADYYGRDNGSIQKLMIQNILTAHY